MACDLTDYVVVSPTFYKGRACCEHNKESLIHIKQVGMQSGRQCVDSKVYYNCMLNLGTLLILLRLIFLIVKKYWNNQHINIIFKIHKILYKM